MIVLDASVLIGYLDADDGHHERAVALLAGWVDEELAVSAITVAEIMVGPIRTRRGHLVQEVLTELGIRPLGLPADAGVDLAQLRVTTGLAMPDCCVLLTAVQASASVATFDRRLATAARKAHVQALP